MSTRLYSQHASVADRDVQVVSGIRRVRWSLFYRSANLHVFDFGWHYELLDLLFEIRPPVRSIVVFHGFTPRDIMPPHLQAGTDQTVAQLANMMRADVVLAASHYSKTFLAEHGVEPERIRVLPLPLRLPVEPRRVAAGNVTNLLFVGRLFVSKGVLDLLRALATLRDNGKTAWRLSIVSNPAASDRGYTTAAHEFIRDANLTPWIDHFGAVEDRARLATLYASSDAVIIPTYHETYCMPLLEALANGCAVIGYASGAVPEISQGLARLVATGDVGALMRELARLFETKGSSAVAIADGGSLPREEFERRTRERTRDLTGEAYDQAFLEIVREVTRSA